MRFALALALLLPLGADARELYPGQYAQVDPKIRNWYNNQINPTTKGNCCSTADGTKAEEDIRGSSYWARFEGSDGWQHVPEGSVLDTPNPTGNPVVWYYHAQDEGGNYLYRKDGAPVLGIRCYAPGPKA